MTEIETIIIFNGVAYKVISEGMENSNGNIIRIINAIPLNYQSNGPFDIGLIRIPYYQIQETFRLTVKEFIEKYPEKAI